MDEARAFYGGILGCQEGRSSVKWQDYSLFGHQLVCHWAGDDYRCTDYYNPVDGDEVPVPHFGIRPWPGLETGIDGCSLSLSLPCALALRSCG